ncbi:AAA family ATPase [Spirosoma soli]|uniref:AAA family ATPase n=1 Tax=Spirosoma soli TaxID=1770529 RepID=A0ABW5MDG0_9BACT
MVPAIPSVIKYLYDTYGIKFILTGSCSYYLKNHFTESLAGRKRIFELYPLDFNEYLAFRGYKPTPKWSGDCFYPGPENSHRSKENTYALNALKDRTVSIGLPQHWLVGRKAPASTFSDWY